MARAASLLTAPTVSAAGQVIVVSPSRQRSVMPVPAEDVAVLPRGVPGGGGDDVVRLVLADLGPRQADGVKAALDVGQVLDRERVSCGRLAL
jgi:hypothetical protein